MLNLNNLKEGLRIYKRSRLIKKKGYPKYTGTPVEICQMIVNKCFNGTYFRTSLGNFPMFYIRDFCLCVPGLMKLGYQDEVYKTLQYALNIYSRNRTLTTTITPTGVPIHVHHYSPDSLPMLLRSLREGRCFDLIEIYKPFLEEQIYYYFENVLDMESGLVRIGDFSSMKDNFKRESSCYDNCMLAMLSFELGQLGLINPFRGFNFKKQIINSFWNGSYFFDDLKKRKYVAGDAQVFPFWCGVFDLHEKNEKEMLTKVILSIQKVGLDKPFPLKYTKKPIKSNIMFPFNLIIPDYETNTIWMHLGLCYLEIIKLVDIKLYKEYLEKYTDLIKKHRNFLELYNSNGSVFKRRLYAADDSMLWAAKYLELLEQ